MYAIICGRALSKDGMVLGERAGVISYREGRTEVGNRRRSCLKIVDGCSGSLLLMPLEFLASNHCLCYGAGLIVDIH